MESVKNEAQFDCLSMQIHKWERNTLVICEGFGSNNISSVIIKFQIIGGEPITTNRAQIQAPWLLLRSSWWES